MSSFYAGEQESPQEQINEEEETMPIDEETQRQIKEAIDLIWMNALARCGPNPDPTIAFIHYVAEGIAGIKFHKNRKRVAAPVDPDIGVFVPSPKDETNPKKIVTFTGLMYPTSEMYMFHYVEGVGWVHCHEAGDIASDYRRSNLSNRWFRSSTSNFVSLQLPSDDNDSCGECEESEVQDKPEYCCNQDHGMGKVYFMMGDGVTVYDGDNAQVLVSRYTKLNYTKKCCWSDRYYFNSLIKGVRASDKYKQVSIHYIGNGKPFRQCDSCGQIFERDKLVELEPGQAGTPLLCVKCYSVKTQVPSVIQPHNGKKYPRAIYDFTERLGSEVIDGAVFSTHEKSKYQEPRLYGVEIEAEFDRNSMKRLGLTRFKIAAEVLKFFPNFVAVKEDGSLTMNGKYSDGNPDAGHNYAGLEIVTAPAGLKHQKAMWTKFPEFQYYKFFRAWDTDTCGFHVHISKASLTSLQIGRMLRFVNHSNNKKFVEIVAGRSEKKFTKYYPKNLSDALYPERVNNPEEGSEHDRQRRVALNIANEHTVEFRIFRGTVNANHIIRNIEFCEAVCNFCYPASRSFAELDHPKYFVGWVERERKTYPEFARWMAHHGLIKSRVIKDKQHNAPEEGEDKTNDPVLSGPGAAITFDDTGAPVVNGKVVDKKRAILKGEASIPNPPAPEHAIKQKKPKGIFDDPWVLKVPPTAAEIKAMAATGIKPAELNQADIAWLHKKAAEEEAAIQGLAKTKKKKLADATADVTDNF